METVVQLLLVEDEPLIALEVEDTLQAGGYAVLHVGSGAEALAALESDHLQLAGVITDISLGAGPDGWEIATRARELRPHFPVVYMSGNSAHEHTIHGVPGSVVLQKPFAPAQVVTAISSLLNTAPPEV